MERAAAIELRQVSKRFGRRVALDSLSFAVPEGTAYGFLGPNGAGKSTLIKLLVGLRRPSSGEVRVLGRTLPGDAEAALARVGAVVEEPRFYPHLTARENLEVAAALRGNPTSSIGELLERVGLAGREDERVRRYSLGMKQRLGIARALLGDPELLILDEPTNGLDPEGIRDLRVFLREFVEAGKTVFLSSHLLDEIERICDIVAIAANGRLVAEGKLGEVVRAGETLEDRFLALTSSAEAA